MRIRMRSVVSMAALSWEAAEAWEEWEPAERGLAPEALHSSDLWVRMATEQEVRGRSTQRSASSASYPVILNRRLLPMSISFCPKDHALLVLSFPETLFFSSSLPECPGFRIL